MRKFENRFSQYDLNTRWPFEETFRLGEVWEKKRSGPKDRPLKGGEFIGALLISIQLYWLDCFLHIFHKISEV